MEGRILGNRYELIERIGGGGMAVVYKAKCRLLNRFVAVKILRSEFTDDDEFVKRFRIEAQAAASLSHPNIVSIFDVGRDGDIHYIVMEFIDGITLKEYINKKDGLSWREAINIAIQICSAIEQAHKNHIVHRDIKPHNILLTKEGIAKVADFGIARAVSSATITMVGSTIGSVHYFSPEQARGGYTDEKSDLYSLGITIYEMVTGKVPFDGESPVAVALKHIQEKAERPSDVNAEVPRGVNDLILKAIKKDKNLRYQNATEMLSDLQRTFGEPNAKIAGSGIVEELPTKKMQAVGAEMNLIDDDEPEEEEVDMTAKRKKDKLSIWLGIVTGLIIAGILFYIGIKVVLPVIIPDNSAEFIVQDYTDKNFNDVKEELKKYGIKAEDKERVYSDVKDVDIIVSQEIATGNTLKQGNTINFVVSDGPQRVEIPDVSGDESRFGEQRLRDLDLVVSSLEEYNDTVPTGHIIRTEPAALEKVKPKESVAVYVSLGPELEKVKTPNIIGLNRAEAEKLILDSKLSVGVMIPSDVISEVALIVKQYPLAGVEVDEDTPVEMTFQIDDGTTDVPGDGTSDGNTTGDNTTGNGTSGQAETGGNNQGTAGDKNKTTFITVALNPNRTYGEKVMVYIEATPSDTNRLQVIVNQEVVRGNFPFTREIPLAKSGTTHIIVKLDGVLAQEVDR